MERRTENIKPIIDQLPNHQAPDFVWKNICTRLDSYFNESSGPSEKAPDFVWGQIADRLDEIKPQPILEKAISELPEYAAPNSVEESIFQSLHHVSSYRWNRWLTWVSGAAAVLVFGLGIYGQLSSVEKVTLSSYQEVIEDTRTTLTESINQISDEDEITPVIEQYCQISVIECQSPEFEHLFRYYRELEASKKELISEIRQTPELQLMDYLIRVEKEKNEVGKQLLQIVIG